MEAVDLQKAFEQGGLLAVVLILGFFYRRDFMLQAQKKDDVIALLSQTVTANTTAMLSLQGTNERLSRAIEKYFHLDLKDGES